jgi:hypothetical protein
MVQGGKAWAMQTRLWTISCEWTFSLTCRWSSEFICRPGSRPVYVLRVRTRDGSGWRRS